MDALQLSSFFSQTANAQYSIYIKYNKHVETFCVHLHCNLFRASGGNIKFLSQCTRIHIPQR